MLEKESPETCASSLHEETGEYCALGTPLRSDVDARDEALVKHMSLVKSETRRARARFPRHIDPDELEASALEGLFSAVNSYDPSFNVPFESYARRRIRGAIVDRVRNIDGIPRTAWKAEKTLSRANSLLIQKLGRHPSEDELAVELCVTGKQLGYMQRQAQVANKLSLDAGNDSSQGESMTLGETQLRTGEHDTAVAHLERKELIAQLADGLAELPDRERAILVLYYYEGIAFNEIAAAMGVSESRISQIHTRALARLKARFSTERLPDNESDEDDDVDSPDAATVEASPSQNLAPLNRSMQGARHQDRQKAS